MNSQTFHLLPLLVALVALMHAPRIALAMRATVQFGPATKNNTAGTMFNMTNFQDVDNTLADNFNMADIWPMPSTLRFRHITFRQYQVGYTGRTQLCAIYNRPGWPSDGLGGMRATVTLRGLSGQKLSWVNCDDRLECTGAAANVLSAKHTMLFPHSDGWCVSGLNEGGISVVFDDVNGFEGVSFQGSNGIDDVYYFVAKTAGVVDGEVDEHGLVSDGVIDEIVFQPKGIEIPGL